MRQLLVGGRLIPSEGLIFFTSNLLKVIVGQQLVACQLLFLAISTYVTLFRLAFKLDCLKNFLLKRNFIFLYSYDYPNFLYHLKDSHPYQTHLDCSPIKNDFPLDSYQQISFCFEKNLFHKEYCLMSLYWTETLDFDTTVT